MSAARITAPVGTLIVTAARVGLGVLWVAEGVQKVAAGFGAADIALVVEAAHTSRIPAAFTAVADTVLRPLAPLFGVGVPLWELLLGFLLAAGVAPRAAAIASTSTLLTYWSSDQLTPAYPLAGVLGLLVLAAPVAARRWTLARAITARRRRDATPPG